MAALSVSYWSPMEKLILHLSPVARRRTLKNNNNKQTSSSSSSLGRHAVNRHRNRSEPNVRSASSLKNVNAATNSNCNYHTNNHDQVSNNSCFSCASGEKDNKIDCDVKTLRLYSINQVRNQTNKFLRTIKILYTPFSTQQSVRGYLYNILCLKN